MKARYWIFALILLVGFTSCEEDSTLSEAEVVAGLKEALEVGTDNSVEQTSKNDGYYGNVAIRILFPEEAETIKNALQLVPGGNTLVDELVLKLNRAAEDAATEAKPIFIDAITGITIQDGFDILFGTDTAATHYLRQKTFQQLRSTFKPDIEKSLDKVGANDAWSAVTTRYNAIPLVKPVNTDLADYTTVKALDGLFIIVGEEEKKIRENPAARVTDLLQKVFSELDE